MWGCCMKVRLQTMHEFTARQCSSYLLVAGSVFYRKRFLHRCAAGNPLYGAPYFLEVKASTTESMHLNPDCIHWNDSGCPKSIRQVYKFATRAKYIELCFEANAEKWYAKYKSCGGGMGWRSLLYSNCAPICNIEYPKHYSCIVAIAEYL